MEIKNSFEGEVLVMIKKILSHIRFHHCLLVCSIEASLNSNLVTSLIIFKRIDNSIAYFTCSGTPDFLIFTNFPSTEVEHIKYCHFLHGSAHVRYFDSTL